MQKWTVIFLFFSFSLPRTHTLSPFHFLYSILPPSPLLQIANYPPIYGAFGTFDIFLLSIESPLFVLFMFLLQCFLVQLPFRFSILFGFFSRALYLSHIQTDTVCHKPLYFSFAHFAYIVKDYRKSHPVYTISIH